MPLELLGTNSFLQSGLTQILLIIPKIIRLFYTIILYLYYFYSIILFIRFKYYFYTIKCNDMTSRSFKYLRNKRLKPLRFICKTVPGDKKSNFKDLWERGLSQPIDYKPNELFNYDGMRFPTFFDDSYPASFYPPL